MPKIKLSTRRRKVKRKENKRSTQEIYKNSFNAETKYLETIPRQVKKLSQ
jgi:hypothetical protein